MCGFREKPEGWKIVTESQKLASSRAPSYRSLDLVLGLLPLVLGFQVILWIAYLPTALRGNADFRNCYSAGLILKSGRGHQLYDYSLQRDIQNTTISQSPAVLPFVHLPYEALLFAPFTFLSYHNAFLAFLILNMVFLSATYLLLRKRLWRTRQIWRWFPVLFFVGFAPVSAALLQGQDSLLTLLLFSAALFSFDSENELAAGLFVGLALYKFQLVLPIMGVFLLWRRWRVVAGAGISALGVLAVSAALSGVSGLAKYFLSLRDISTKFSAANEVLYVMPVTKMPNLRGMILAVPKLPSGVALGTVIVVSVLLLAVAVWAGMKASTQWQLALGTSIAALIGYHVLMHDLSILLIPIAMLLSQKNKQVLWVIPMMWLAVPICFIGYTYLVTLPILALFLVLASVVRKNGKQADAEFAAQVSIGISTLAGT